MNPQEGPGSSLWEPSDMAACYRTKDSWEEAASSGGPGPQGSKSFYLWNLFIHFTKWGKGSALRAWPCSGAGARV